MARATGAFSGRVAEPWDLKRGGERHDVRVPANLAVLEQALRRTLCAWWAPECKTFSRARGKPVPGAKSWPRALRSGRFPAGLPELQREDRRADLLKVEQANELADTTFRCCLEALQQGRYFAIENPANAYLWNLPRAVELAQSKGVHRVTFTNCCFAGGERNKLTAVLTNAQFIAGALEGRLCRGRDLCERTGAPHLTWAPVVRDGVIATYPTEAEAEYPAGLCVEVAKGVAELVEAAHSGDRYEWDFIEVFSGPNAPLSRAVAAQLQAVGSGSFGSSFSR